MVDASTQWESQLPLEEDFKMALDVRKSEEREEKQQSSDEEDEEKE